MTTLMITPPTESDSSRIGPGLWRKHALPFGTFTYKDGRTIDITPEFARRLKENFDARVRDSVPVPAHGAGGHSEDWRHNKGQTVGLEIDPDKGIFVTLRVDDEADAAIAEQRLTGVSLSFEEDYADVRQGGRRIGPVLRHTALTNVNYIHGTEPFERALNLSEGTDEVVYLSAPDEIRPPHLAGLSAADAAEVARLVRDATTAAPAAGLALSPEDQAEVERILRETA